MTALTQYTISMLIGLSLFGACKSKDAVPADQVALRTNESARIGNITVLVDTLQTNWCPIVNGICFLPDYTFISAIVSTNMARQRVRFYGSARAARPDSVGITLAGQPYKIVVRDIIPHAGQTVPKNGRQAIIQVTKL